MEKERKKTVKTRILKTQNKIEIQDPDQDQNPKTKSKFENQNKIKIQDPEQERHILFSDAFICN